MSKLHEKSRERVNLVDVAELRAHNPAPDAVLAEAKTRFDRCVMSLGIGHDVLVNWIMTKCYYQIPTTAIDTMAVIASGDGTVIFAYNPYFVLQLETDEDVEFVIMHEGRHLAQRHLFVEPELRKDDDFTLACEASINHVCLGRLGRKNMPEARQRGEDGKPTGDPSPTGVDPKKLHKSYVDDLTKQGLTPVTYEKFVDTDFGLYTELKRMAKPPSQKQQFQVCVHQKGNGEGQDPSSGGQGKDKQKGQQPGKGKGQDPSDQPGNGGTPGDTEGGLPMDQDAVDAAVSAAIEALMTAARQGDEKARQTLLELADRSEGANERLTNLWGSYGIMGLRGKTDATKKVEWWKQWTMDTLASKLREGQRLIYPKKRAGILLALGQDPMLARRGRERTKVVHVFYDTSGSMPGHVIEWLSSLVGQTEGIEFKWFMFDGIVEKFEPGEAVMGGGGTNFQNCVDVFEGRLKVEGFELDDEPDAAIMVTDGYAPHVKPQDPDKWIWLITENGDDWPDSAKPPMSCHTVITGDM